MTSEMRSRRAKPCGRERNEPFFSIPLQIEYQDSLNSDNFFGAEPRQCKVSRITARSDRRGDIRFFRVKYEIAYRRETWDLQMLNKGHFKKVGSNLTDFKFNDGSPGRIDLLDADGDVAGTIPSWERFKIYRERPFIALNLPNPNNPFGA